MALLWWALAACTSRAVPSTPETSAAQTTVQQPPPAWLENVPEQALQQARDQRRLVFADLWAPWCHTCLSMRALVLNEARVPELANVVRLAVDTERGENERFLQRYPAVVWPTFYLIDPETREVRGRWLGGASAQQLSQ